MPSLNYPVDLPLIWFSSFSPLNHSNFFALYVYPEPFDILAFNILMNLHNVRLLSPTFLQRTSELSSFLQFSFFQLSALIKIVQSALWQKVNYFDWQSCYYFVDITGAVGEIIKIMLSRLDRPYSWHFEKCKVRSKWITWNLNSDLSNYAQNSSRGFLHQ